MACMECLSLSYLTAMIISVVTRLNIPLASQTHSACVFMHQQNTTSLVWERLKETESFFEV